MRSGALITAHLALDQGREVFAVPGAINAPNSAGCNGLIRDGEAALVTNPRDIARELGGGLRRLPRTASGRSWGSFRGKTREPVGPDFAAAGGIVRACTTAAGRKTPHPGRAQRGAPPDRAGRAGRRRARPEDILERTDLPAARVMTALTLLELDGVLARESGRIVIQ